MNSTRRSTALLLTMAAITGVVTLDTTITGVILPSIGRSLHASFEQLEWVVTGYMLPFAALLLPAGAWADFRGRREATLAGLGIFAAASLVCGLAPTAGWLIFGRVLQGVGASLLPTASLAIVGHAFRGEARLRAFALVGTVIGIVTVLGPIVGGLVASWVGWKWAFLVNLPVCAGLAAATLATAPESKDPNASHFDLSGVLLSAAGLALLTSGFIAANKAGLMSAAVLGRGGAAVILGGLFVWTERRSAQPMIDLSLLARGPFQGAVTAMLGYAATAQILIFFAPLYLQDTYHFSALAAGLRMAPYAVPLFVLPRVAAVLARTLAPAVILASGLWFTAAGNLIMGFAAAGGSYPWFAAGMTVAGVGGGLLNGETAKAFFATVPAEKSGLASGLGTTTRFSGLLLAVALMGAVLAHAGFAAVFFTQSLVGAGAALATYWLLRGAQGGLATTAAPVME